MILYIRTLHGRNADFIDITVASTRVVAGGEGEWCGRPGQERPRGRKTCGRIITGDQKVSVHLMITVQKNT
jgi:hypothetical protein